MGRIHENIEGLPKKEGSDSLWISGGGGLSKKEEGGGGGGGVVPQGTLCLEHRFTEVFVFHLSLSFPCLFLFPNNSSLYSNKEVYIFS